jgi:PAS domain S-box-containing protein
MAMLHPEDAAAMLKREASHFGRGIWMVEHEMRLKHRDGHWVWVLSRGQVIEWDSDGNPQRISGVHLDITALKGLEAALAREHDTLAQIMATSVSGITAVDATGRLVFANKEAETILGRARLTPEDGLALAEGWGITDLDGNLIPPVDLPVARVLAGQGIVRNYRHAIRWADGTRRVVSVNAAPLSEPGTDVAVVCSWTDITEAVENEARLRAAMADVEAASRAKSEFLANMSHEIRTPLNGVLGMAYVLEGQLDDAAQKEKVRVIRESGEHLLGVINDILDLAKIEAGRLTLEARAFKPSLLAERITALHSLRAREKGISLTVDCGDGAENWLLGDAQRVMQILHNLVGNAVKFTETGGVHLALGVSASGCLSILVKDTGIGMAAKDIAHVFEDFIQADGGISRRYGGTGLGLPIVRRLARLMGGDITLKSAPGQGLEARVELRLSNAPAGEDEARADMPRVPPMSVLVAEDNATNRLILKAMLETLGQTAKIVASGAEALELWDPGVFDAVLLDISMPDMDGLATLNAVRAKADLLGQPHPPTIAVTANAMTHQVRDYLVAGFSACVAKPIRLDSLAEALILCQTLGAAAEGP